MQIPGLQSQDYAALAQQESELWGEEKSDERTSWFDSPLIGLYINRCISGNPHIDWLDHLKQHYLPSSLPLGLNVGCGHGDLERQILQRNIADTMHGFDISEKAIESAKEQAQEEGLADQVDYFTADANHIEQAGFTQTYDVIFASMALHHFAKLEACLDGLNNLLKPGGLFIVNEYVGPDRFQWTDRQLDAANRYFKTIPTDLRVSLRDQKPISNIVRVPEDYMKTHFAFEAICSEQIVPAVKKRFDVLEHKPYGGTILHLVFEAIMGNFKEEKVRFHAYMVQAAIEWERMLIDYGILTSDHVFMVCRKRS